MTRFKTFSDGHYLSWWILRRCKTPLDTLRHFRETLRRFVVGSVRWNWYSYLWRHQMETFSALLALGVGNLPVAGEFPSQRPVTRSFDIFYLRLNRWLSKQSMRRWFKAPSRSLWRHCNGVQHQEYCWRRTKWQTNKQIDRAMINIGQLKKSFDLNIIHYTIRETTLSWRCGVD